MQKKLFVIALCAVMTVSFFTACGGKKATVPAAKVPVLKWVTVGSGKPVNYDSWVKKVNAYIEPIIGAHVDVEVIGWGDWDSRRSMIIASNEPFDIIFGNDGTFQSDMTIGALMDISPYLDKAPGLKKLIPENYFKVCKVNGKLYAVPTYKDSSMTQYFVWNKDILDKYGITDYENLKSLEAAYPVLEKIAKGEKKPSFPLGSSGVYQIFSPYDGIGLGIPCIGVRYDDAQAKVVNVLQTQEIQAQLAIIHKMYQNGIINKDAFTAREIPPPSIICGIAQGWPSAAKTVWGPQRGCEAVVSQFSPSLVMNDTVQGSLNSLSVNCKNPEKAMALLELINTDTKLRDMFYFGEEGVNFSYVEKDGLKKVEKINHEWTMAGYTQATFFNVSPQVGEFNPWDEVKVLNEQALPSVMLGFQLDVSSFKTELANCRQVWQSGKAELLTGTRDPKAAIADITKELKTAGIETIIAETQKQIDSFLRK